MARSILNKLADVTLAFYDKGSRVMSQLGGARLSSWCARHYSKPAALLGLELFVAMALTVNFFYLVRTQCVPKPNGNVFSAFSSVYLWNSEPALDVIPVNWRTRLLAPVLSSWFMETQLSPTEYAELKKTHPTFGKVCQTPEFQNPFGFYHAAWLFLLFLMLIYFRRDALLLMLGVFAGLMYNLAGPSGSYYYSWDMPAMFFFTLAILLFDKGWMGLLLPALVLGGLFKETVLCCSLLVLLGSHWDWKRRLAGFLAVVLATLGLNHLLMVHYGSATQLMELNGATNLHDLLHNSLLFRNLRLLFSLDRYHVIFANGGALLLMMLIPWRDRRDVLFKLVIVVFAAGQIFYGIFTEVRIWYEVLPLGWILVSEAVSRRWSVSPENPLPAGNDSVRLVSPRLRKSYWLAVSGLLIVLFGAFVTDKLTSPRIKSDDEVMRELNDAAMEGDVVALYNLGRKLEERGDFQNAATWFLRAAEKGHREAQYRLGALLYVSGGNHEDAVGWFSRAAARGQVDAQYRLGVMYWNGEGVQENHSEAFKLLLAAAQQGELHAEWIIGKIYLEGNGVRVDLVAAYKWSKLAMLQGHSEARKQVNTCLALMTADQLDEAEKQVKEFLKTAK